MKQIGPELWLAIATLIGSVVLFALGKDEPAYLLLGGGTWGAGRAVSQRGKPTQKVGLPASKIKPTNPPKD